MRHTPLLAAILVALSAHRAGWAEQDREDSLPCKICPAAERDNAADEVIVTARRVSEAEQSVPIAMGVVNAAELEAAGITTLERLQRLEPSLHVFGFNPRLTSIAIRALGGNVGLTSDGLEGGVGVFVDDVYLGRVGSAMFSLLDIERIEVLRGPQGTLFGRNTTAGVINVVTRAPQLDAAERKFEASVGDYDFSEIKGLISGPLRGDTIAGRIALQRTRRDGFVTNVHTGESVQNRDDTALRGQLSFNPSAAVRVGLSADYASQDQRCCSSAAVGVMTALDNGSAVSNGYLARVARLGYEPLPFEPFDRRVDTDARVQANMRQRGVAARVDWKSKKLDFVSITASRDWDWNPAGDFDDTPFPAVTFSHTANRQRQLSQELRVARSADGELGFVAGYYHFYETVDGFGLFGYGPAAPAWFFPVTTAADELINDAALNGFVSETTSSVTTRSDALFGHVELPVTELLDLGIGLRYTDERRHGGFSQHDLLGQDLARLGPSGAAAAQAIRTRFNAATQYAADIEDEAVTGNVSLSYAVTSAVGVYLAASRGHKAGGLNVGNFPEGFDPAIRPDTVQHYEIGLKSFAAGGSISLEAALFKTNVSDYQTSLLQTNAAGARLLQFISNVDEVSSKGGEVEFRWTANRHLAVSAAFAYADARYLSFPNGPCPPEISLTPAACDLSNQPLAGAPKRASAIALDGVVELTGPRSFYWRVDHSRRSLVYTAVSNSRYSRVDGLSLTNLQAGVRADDGRWDAALSVRNLLDEDYFQLISARSTGLIAGLTGEPRTVAVTVRSRF